MAGNYVTLEDAIDALQEASQEAELVIIPPDPDALSDEEDVDENEMGNIVHPPNDIVGNIELHLDNVEADVPIPGGGRWLQIEDPDYSKFGDMGNQPLWLISIKLAYLRKLWTTRSSTSLFVKPIDMLEWTKMITPSQHRGMKLEHSLLF